MTLELAVVVSYKGVAWGLMMGRTRSEVDWGATLGHMDSGGWRRSVAGMHVGRTVGCSRRSAVEMKSRSVAVGSTVARPV